MTANNQQVVVGVFDDDTMAERAVDELKQAGFKDDQIGFIRRDTGGNTGYDSDATGEQAADTAGSAVTGAVGGGVLGGILGAAAALLIPGIGPVVAGGILAATLTGAAVGAAAGGLLGALTKMGVPEEDARYYQDEFEAGRTLVTVRAGGRQQEALQILQTNGAYDASTRPANAMGTGANFNNADYNTAGQQTGRTGSTDTTNMNTGAGDFDTDQGRKVQIREEQLQAQKQPVQTGEVRIGKKVVTEEKSINVPVTREEVFVEQVNVAPRPADQAISDVEGDTIRVPVVEEQVQVTKQPVVTGEVQVSKRQVQENRQVSDTVRREEATIEREGDVNIQGADMDQYQTNQQDDRP